MIKRILKIALAPLLIGMLLSGAGLVVWGYSPQGAMPEAIRALESDSQVTVGSTPWLVFAPRNGTPTTGFISYPGGHVDPRAYAPMAHKIARLGHIAVITPMPLSLAFFGIDEGLDVIRAYPSIKHWAVGGHSLGGVAASTFARNHADKIQALILFASYPADYDNLAGSPLRVVSISGSRDGLSTPDKIRASRRVLPPNTTWVQIDGANHGQFGWYGEQSGDGTPQISREQQQERIVNATADVLTAISEQ